MSFAEIRRTLETASRLPEEELRAAVAHADELTPLVVALIEKLKAGVYLLPDQQWLLIYGIHVLAAARHTALWPAWCDLLLVDDAIDGLFGYSATDVVGGVTLSLVGDDSATVFALLGKADEHDSGWALFRVLARLAWDGRVDVARTREFLTRFERDELAASDNDAWIGWLEAIALLGLVELEPVIDHVLAKPAFRFVGPTGDIVEVTDRRDTIERLEGAAADLADGERFVVEGIAAIDDPVEGLRWLDLTSASETAPPPDPDEPPDPAAAIRLTEDQELWLRGFLDSAQVPETTMNFEALDGFFCALGAGPAPVPLAECLPQVWGDAATGGAPRYDSPAQREYVERLLGRYKDTIARRIAGRVAAEPFLFDDDGDEIARDWSSGFMVAVGLRPRDWAPLLRHRSAGRLIASIILLYRDDPEQPLTPDLRRDIVDSLPEMMLAVADFWRDPSHGLAQPIRATKIGRNDPCPCGSGKKYKKCCGAPGLAPVLH